LPHAKRAEAALKYGLADTLVREASARLRSALCRQFPVL